MTCSVMDLDIKNHSKAQLPEHIFIATLPLALVVLGAMLSTVLPSCEVAHTRPP